MKNRLVSLWVFFFIFMTSISFASIEELNGYFEIRDTISLMNSEMKKGLELKDEPSLFDEDQIELKLESFIKFMQNRVSMYAASDSKLKYHYVKKLNALLDETYKLLSKARPIIKAKAENKNEKKDYLPKVTYSTIVHPYFDSIDFRTLASREPLDGDYTEVNPVPSNKKETKKTKTPEVVTDIEDLNKNKQVANSDKPKQEQEKVAVQESQSKKDDKVKKDIEEKPVIVEKPAEADKKTKTTDKTIPNLIDPMSPNGDFMRPMAIMIENHNKARPQSGLLDAEIIYEMPVEGGITRFMALYRKMPGLVGPVRSCREYFVDRALEVEALYVHCGGSPMGYAYLSKSKIRSIDEIKNSPPFFRDKIRKAPHNLYGKGEAIYKYMAKRTDMRVKKSVSPLNYGIRSEIGENPGNYLKINYHGNYNVVIKEENGVYHRYMNNILHLDRETNKPLEAKTVILQVASMKTVDAIGRQEISFIGSGTAWIFEKGKRTSVTWHKVAPRSKTVYTDKNGKEYLFSNSGQTWIQVVSPSHKIFFEPVKEKDVKASKGKDVKASKGKDVKASKEKDVKASKGKDVKASKDKDLKAEVKTDKKEKSKTKVAVSKKGNTDKK